MTAGKETEWSKLPKLLRKELEVRRKHREFKDLRKLEQILKTLRAMIQDELLPELSALLKIESSVLESGIRDFCDPYFARFSQPIDLLHDYKKHTDDYSSIKKVFQLSHAFGVYRTRIAKENSLDQDIVNLFLGDLFIKAFESLPLILEPIFRHHSDELKTTKIGARKAHHYKFLEKIFPHSIFAKESISITYNNLRNSLAHSHVLIEDGHIHKIESKRIIKIPVRTVVEKMKIMLLSTILYATEMDIRMLGVAMRKNENCYDAWMEYFEIYVKWFLKIDKDIKLPE